MTAATTTYRLTQYAHGGGCACKIPPGELEESSAGSPGGLRPGPARRPGRRRRRRRRPAGRADRAWSAPPTSSPPSWTTPTTGAGSPLPMPCPTSTPWAGGRSMAVNLVGWPRDVLPVRAARPRCCAGAWTSARQAGCHVAGGHSIDDPEPKYGMAVTGIADPASAAAQRRRRRRAADQPDQAARRRDAQQPAQEHRRGLPAGGRLDGRAQRARPRRTPSPPASSRRPTSPGSACWGTCSRWPAPPG